MRPRHFASDNNAGVCPEAWTALDEANRDHARGYGDDPWTARACDLIREFFECDCDVFFVFNGTAANALALAAMCRSYEAVLCHDFSHIQRDECGAPGFFSGGATLIPLPGDHAQLDPGAVEEAIRSHFPLHASKPGALSLTQLTECGTCYSVAGLQSLTEVAHRYSLRTHLDGARLANAIAWLKATPADLTWRAGIDLVSLGMTKNGGLCSEALVVFNPDLARDLEYRVKQAGQLASKMRFLAAPWVGMLGTGAWLRHAAHANAMAERLARALTELPGITLRHACEGNGVFVDLPLATIEGLRKADWNFYVFEGATGCRLMCSWDTTPQDVDDFVNAVKALAEVNTP